jgi:hypothetical protein
MNSGLVDAGLEFVPSKRGCSQCDTKRPSGIMGPILAAVSVSFVVRYRHRSGVGDLDHGRLRPDGVRRDDHRHSQSGGWPAPTVTVDDHGDVRQRHVHRHFERMAITICTVTTNASRIPAAGRFTVPASTTTAGYGRPSRWRTPAVTPRRLPVSVAGVTPAVTTATTAPLAFTGTDAVATSALGAGVLCLGGLLVLGSRKRRRNTLV